jgi:hypothetical protein
VARPGGALPGWQHVTLTVTVTGQGCDSRGQVRPPSRRAKSCRLQGPPRLPASGQSRDVTVARSHYWGRASKLESSSLMRALTPSAARHCSSHCHYGTVVLHRASRGSHASAGPPRADGAAATDHWQSLSHAGGSPRVLKRPPRAGVRLAPGRRPATTSRRVDTAHGAAGLPRRRDGGSLGAPCGSADSPVCRSRQRAAPLHGRTATPLRGFQGLRFQSYTGAAGTCQLRISLRGRLPVATHRPQLLRHTLSRRRESKRPRLAPLGGRRCAVSQ